MAAGLIAADKCSKPNQKKKYGVLTLIDCRSDLDPALSIHHFGNHATLLVILIIHKRTHSKRGEGILLFVFVSWKVL